MQSRLDNVIKNTAWVFTAQLVSVLFGFISRKIFLSKLGVELLGVNSLFGDVLTLLSFADMGIGVAIVFALYKPIAENDYEKIRSLLKYYKKVYNWVVACVVCVGCGFFPFIQQLNSQFSTAELTVYYALFQLNNVIGYFWAYRESYVMACQQERKLTIINIIYTVVQYCAQIPVVLLTGDYLLFLWVGIFATLLKKILANMYIVRKYPETNVKGARVLEQSEKKSIFKKARAMLVHRIGNLLINQTDSLVISYVIGVSQWGMVSNYLLLKRLITTITDKIYSAMVPSMGNLLVVGERQQKNNIFEIYDLMNFWLSGFCFVALATLSSPFVGLFFGQDMTLDQPTVFVFFFSFLIDSLRAPVSLLREASGHFEKDKWFTIVAAVVNLSVSILCGVFFGVSGVFVGTVCAMLVLHISRTTYLFSTRDFSHTPISYFGVLGKYVLVALVSYGVTQGICQLISFALELSFLSFVLRILVVVVVPNAIYLVCFARTREFIQTKEMILRKLTPVKKI